VLHAASVDWTGNTDRNSREYVKITKDYALAAATAFQNLSPSPDAAAEPFRFVYVSGDGATFNPGMMTPVFGRVKGETELGLAEMRKTSPRFHTSTVRPAFVDMADHSAIRGYAPEPAGVALKLTAAALGPLIRTTMKSKWSPTEPLGHFLTDMATGRWDREFESGGAGVEKVGAFPVVDNPTVRRLMGLD
jgi:hypothetical protein